MITPRSNWHIDLIFKTSAVNNQTGFIGTHTFYVRLKKIPLQLFFAYNIQETTYALRCHSSVRKQYVGGITVIPHLPMTHCATALQLVQHKAKKGICFVTKYSSQNRM
jgi:hypothetical protein